MPSSSRIEWKRLARGRVRYAIPIALSAIGAVAVLPVWSPADSSHAYASAPPAGGDAPGLDSVLWMDMRNVDLHIDQTHVMHVRSLRGRVVATHAGQVPWLDQPTSFIIQASGGTVALDGDGIAALLNEIAFNYPGAPIRNLQVQVADGQVVQRGMLHKGVNIPFRMWAVPVLQPDGRIRLHPSRLTIFGVNGLTLMHALGLHLSSMMDLRKAHGVSVSGDDLYLDPLAIIPPPLVTGRLAAVRVEGAQLVQEFATTPDDAVFGTFVRPDSGSRNYIYFRGGQLRFGKLTMTDTDLLIHDVDERDPLDLYFAEYNRQLTAGHTKNLPDLGLRTWMVDYGKLPRSDAP